MVRGTTRIPHKFAAPPYGYQHNVNLSSGDWTKPNDVVICEMRNKSEGTIKTTTRQGETAKSFVGEYDIIRLDIETIHKDTTSSTLRKNQITVYGHYMIDLSGI